MTAPSTFDAVVCLRWSDRVWRILPTGNAIWRSNGDSLAVYALPRFCNSGLAETLRMDRRLLLDAIAR